jgi:hypothetical protein
MFLVSPNVLYNFRILPGNIKQRDQKLISMKEAARLDSLLCQMQE